MYPLDFEDVGTPHDAERRPLAIAFRHLITEFSELPIPHIIETVKKVIHNGHDGPSSIVTRASHELSKQSRSFGCYEFLEQRK
jgi:hypothetical protein